LLTPHKFIGLESGHCPFHKHTHNVCNSVSLKNIVNSPLEVIYVNKGKKESMSWLIGECD